jgi:hypothetical protein
MARQAPSWNQARLALQLTAQLPPDRDDARKVLDYVYEILNFINPKKANSGRRPSRLLGRIKHAKTAR